ncbi:MULTISPECIES: hypothetical protein [Leptolyngbya]|uniref:hypothetical protein n=1 Tax=Leptolyngbya TaxID=47251 RepID=UPI001689643B|nr:hypothetical protein [Leptolyngbya sp. FACHB-1624]
MPDSEANGCADCTHINWIVAGIVIEIKERKIQIERVRSLETFLKLFLPPLCQSEETDTQSIFDRDT